MQTIDRDAPIAELQLPALHLLQATEEPTVADQVPIAQLIQVVDVVDPNTDDQVPALQVKQLAADDNPLVDDQLP